MKTDISDVKPFDISQVAMGFGTAVLANELIDGFFPESKFRKWLRVKLHRFIYSRFCPKWLRRKLDPYSLARGALKLAAASLLNRTSNKLLDSKSAKAAALLMAYDGIRDIVPVEEIASSLAKKIEKAKK